MKNLQSNMLLFLMLLFATTLTSTGQEWFVKHDGNKVELTPKENTWVLYIPDTTYLRTKENLRSMGVQLEKTYILYEKVVVWMESVEKQEVDNIKTALNGTVYYSPVFLLEDENLKHSCGELFIRWNKSLANKEITDLLKRYNLRRIVGERNRWLGDAELYELMPPYHLNSIEVVNVLYKEELVVSAEPNFSYTLKRLFNGTPDDPLYSEQWNLEKIEANSAWSISKGSGVVVAIFDDGVD